MLTPEQWRGIRPVLESALDLDPSQWPAFLDSACSDHAVRAEVESLLAAHAAADTRVLQVAAALRPDNEAEKRFRVPAGEHVGPYKILEEIAEGGMGAVYRASRDDGTYEQMVAIKIVRTELGSEFVSSRFRIERQILASLDHPNIARILDGGTTADGIPYLVMELIEGLPITDFCDQQRLTTAARVELFRAVCSAVQYAHQRLVIHRDIKPNNILVTAKGIPKLLDFGIAKILDPLAIPNGVAATVAGASLLTPEYASPEQFSGAAMSTATDVYSLGCVLYELLCGQRALHLTSRIPHEIAQAVLEKDPDRPSTVIRRAAAKAGQNVGATRGETPRKLQRRLRGDLDNIVMRAIRKEPAARYSSVEQLSEDLRRHLHAEPVRARRNTLGYRAGRWITRHKVAVVSMMAVLLAVVAGLLATQREARVARANELRAERRFNDVRKLANSLIFEIHDSIQPVPGATAARKLIIQRSQEYLESLAGESGGDAALLRELAVAYTKLANIQGANNDSNVANKAVALSNYRKAATLLESARLLQPADRETSRQLAGSYYRLATALQETGDASGRREYVQKSVQILESLGGANPMDADVQYDLGIAYGRAARFMRDDGDSARALSFYLKAHALYEQLHDAQPDSRKFARELSHSHRHIGTFLAIQRQLTQALAHYRAAAALDAAQLALDPKSVETRFNSSLSNNAIGFVLGEQGDVEGALGYYRKALETRRALLAADREDNRARIATADTLVYIGVALARKGDFAGALAACKEALATWETSVRRDPANQEYKFQTAWTQADIGHVYSEMALDAKSSSAQRVEYCRESLVWYRQALPAWIEGQTQVKLGVGDPASLSKLREDIGNCERVAGAGS